MQRFVTLDLDSLKQINGEPKPISLTKQQAKKLGDLISGDVYFTYSSNNINSSFVSSASCKILISKPLPMSLPG